MPVASVKEMIAYAKANPGKTNFGSGSNGSAGHLAGELFKLETGTDVAHIPYKGGAPALQALLAGDTQFMFDNLANAMAQVKGGKVRAIAVTTAQRSKLAPDLPTMAEAGMPGFDISTWFGLLAPAGTPPDVIAKWNADVVKVLNSPDVREKMASAAEQVAAEERGFAPIFGYIRDETSLVRDSLAIDTCSTQAIFEAAREEDAVALAFVEALGKVNARGVSGVIVAYNPEIIVFDGPLARYHGDIVIRYMEPFIDRYLTLPRLAVSSLDGKAPLFGAALYALEAL